MQLPSKLSKSRLIMSEVVLCIESEEGITEIHGDTLIVAIDETGCEDYKDHNFPVFGIGGCAVLARDYGRLIYDPWRSLKATYFGGRDIALHAADLRFPTPDQLNALELFFTKFPFFRFASTSARTFNNGSELSNVNLLVMSVMQQVCDFVSWVRPSQVLFIFEHSQRIGREVYSVLKSYKMENDEYEIVPRVMYATKESRLSCLEVADFIVHPAGAQVRNRISDSKNRRSIIRKDFEIVFNEIDPRFSSYQEMTGALSSKS